jgi:hypothetical protein
MARFTLTAYFGGSSVVVVMVIICLKEGRQEVYGKLQPCEGGVGTVQGFIRRD